MENKEIKKKTIMKKVKEVLQIVLVPAAIIAGAFILKKGIGKPLEEIEGDFDHMNYMKMIESFDIDLD